MDVEDEGVARRRDGDRPLRPSVGVIVKLPVHYVGGPAGRRRVPVESRAHAPGQVPRLVWLGCVTCGRHESLSLADSDGDRAE